MLPARGTAQACKPARALQGQRRQGAGKVAIDPVALSPVKVNSLHTKLFNLFIAFKAEKRSTAVSRFKRTVWELVIVVLKLLLRAIEWSGNYFPRLKSDIAVPSILCNPGKNQPGSEG
jgi:hypothetical protein